jgi:hypothetical protein
VKERRRPATAGGYVTAAGMLSCRTARLAAVHREAVSFKRRVVSDLDSCSHAA